MSAFHFVSYEFAAGEAVFTYRDEAREYIERVRFALGDMPYDATALDRALFLAFLLVGTSYYKVSPTRDVVVEQGVFDAWQAEFLNHVYQEGLSQYAYENNLTRADLAQFAATTDAADGAAPYAGDGIVSLQSGGKDSLLMATLLDRQSIAYTPWHVAHGNEHPAILDTLDAPLVLATRLLDREALRAASQAGGLNGHVPVTYTMLALAVVQAILLRYDTVLAAIAHEGDEPHGWIGDLPVNHQWSKTWQAEQLLAEYVVRYISPNIRVGSPLRGFSELKVAELFAQQAWPRYGASFSSCNAANYKQGVDNTVLSWCGECSKCANSYLLFAPFVAPDVLQSRLGGDLFAKPELTEIFKGLLGVDGVMKPFECVGEVDELRAGYHMAQANGYSALPFDVPPSHFDKDARYSAQSWAARLVV